MKKMNDVTEMKKMYPFCYFHNLKGCNSAKVNGIIIKINLIAFSFKRL